MTSSLGRVWWRNGGPSIPPSRSSCSPHVGSEAHTYSREECSPHMGLGRASQPALDSCLWFLPMQTLGGTADGLSSWAPVTHVGHLACIPDFQLHFRLPQGKHLGSAPADGSSLCLSNKNNLRHYLTSYHLPTLYSPYLNFLAFNAGPQYGTKMPNTTSASQVGPEEPRAAFALSVSCFLLYNGQKQEETLTWFW